LVDMFML